jgi:hypothetical protein
MATAVDPRARRLADYWNYVDVLSLIIAYSRLTRFEGTRAKWHQVIARLKERYGDRAPELFKDIHFERRDPLPPQSDEVAEFLRTIAWSGIAEEPNPAYQVLQLRNGQRRQIIKRVEPRLRDYIPLIRRMSNDLTKAFLTKTSQ